MARRDVDCPSGLQGIIRGLKGKEMRLLGDRRKARSGELFDELLGACWVETTSPGPYRFTSDKPSWLDVLSGDRFHTLFQLRMATYPDEPYSFRVQCSNPTCGGSFEWEVPLDELPVKRLSEESAQRFQKGEPFEARIDERVVRFVLSTGRLERQGARFIKGANADMLRVLATRIVDVEGVEKAKLMAWLEDLELSEHRDLLAQFDEADCGVETNIDVECTECGNVQQIDLPFGPAFFLPKRRS
jgi:hypothetical protein